MLGIALGMHSPAIVLVLFIFLFIVLHPPKPKAFHRKRGMDLNGDVFENEKDKENEKDGSGRWKVEVLHTRPT